MRKRVFGSIFLTSLVTLLLTTGLLLLAVHAGLTNDMRQRLVTESSYGHYGSYALRRSIRWFFISSCSRGNDGLPGYR